VFLVSIQNSLVILDYHINRDFYERVCINKDKPEMKCHGKCKMKEETSKNSAQTEIIKLGFEFNILPAKHIELPKSTIKTVIKEKFKYYFSQEHLSGGYLEILPHPPQVLV
jgi:hypothetical protein